MMVILSAAFLLMRRIAPTILAHSRLLGIGAAIALASIVMAEMVVLVAMGKTPALVMLHWTLLSVKIGALLLAALIFSSATFWKNIIYDTELSLLQVIELGLAIVAVCTVAALMATELPIWLLWTLGAGVTAASLWTFWRNRETAYPLTGAFGVLMSLLLLVVLQGNSAWFFCLVFVALLAAGATTYLRDIESKDDPRWTTALLQYASWIAITAAEAYRFRLD
jgi:hypothetical protein